MKEIERAIEQLNRNIEEVQMHLFECDSRNRKETVYYRLQQDKIQDYLLARSCLQSELDRQENKPLELSELKDMVGEPVWVRKDEKHNAFCFLICYVNDNFIKLINNEADSPLSKFDKNQYFKHNPNGGE